MISTGKGKQMIAGPKQQSTHFSARHSGAHAISLSAQLAEEGLNSLSAEIAILDETGTIILTNKAWQLFATESSPLHRAPSYLGTN